MGGYKYLRQFKQDELLFNDNETRIILKFIFKEPDQEIIDTLPMSDYLRGFAQGLLLEAIDASYSVGYIKGLFESTANPTKGAMKIIKSFAKKATLSWFKNAKVNDLQNVKIYDFIRDNIARSFRTALRDFLANEKAEGKLGAFIAYSIPAQGIITRWV